MLQQRRITWTQPPDAETTEALYAIEDLEAAGPSTGSGTDKGNQKELTRLRAQVGAATLEEWRITLASLSVLTKSRYFAHVRSLEPWLEAQFGPIAGEGENTPERATMTITAYRAALVLASISGMEKRSRPVLDTDARDGWEPCALPAEWATVEGYLASAPPALHDAMTAAADALNPQVMLRGNQEQAKKFGGVSGS